MGLNTSAIRGVSEVAFWVRDLDRAIAFYRDRLGLLVESIEPGKNAFLRAGDLYVVLFNPESPGSALAGGYLSRTGGPQGEVYHVAFRVEANLLDSHAAELRTDGVAVTGPVEFDTGRRSYFLEDPDSHYLELTDR